MWFYVGWQAKIADNTYKMLEKQQRALAARTKLPQLLTSRCFVPTYKLTACCCCCCCQAYLEYLTAAGKWSAAADSLPQLLKDQGALWERWLYVFAQV
jgi:hypothetical protein